MPSYIKLAMGAGVIVVLAGVILWNYPSSDAHKTDQIPMEVGNKPAPATGGGTPSGGATPRTASGGNPRTATPRSTAEQPGRPSPATATPGGPGSSPARSPVQTPPLGGSATPPSGDPMSPTTTAPILRSEPRTDPDTGLPSTHGGSAGLPPHAGTTATQPAVPPITAGDSRPSSDIPISTPSARDPSVGSGTPVVRPDPAPPPPSGSTPASVTPSTPIRAADVPGRSETSTPPARSEPTRLPVGKRYVIQDGDMLGSIARDEYGAEKYWSVIVEANPGLDPAKLRVGQAINLPPKDAVLKRNTTPAGASVATAPPPRTEPAPPRESATFPIAAGSAAPTVAARRYTVAKGDTLMSIARRMLKDDARWREIYELNRDKLTSPDAIKAGMELALPAERGGASATPARSGAGAANRDSTTRTPERRPTTRPAGNPR